jgi:dUTP pyrophosphatase
MRAHPTDAGLDFFCPDDLTEKDMAEMFSKTGHELSYVIGADGFVKSMVIEWGQSACIPSGIKAKFPDGYCMEFHNKSGIGMKKGLIAGAQTIDSSYQGVWHIDLHNTSKNPATISAGDKIAQFVMYPIECPVVEIVPDENTLYAGVKSERGEGAFGSTGTK